MSPTANAVGVQAHSVELEPNRNHFKLPTRFGNLPGDSSRLLKKGS